MSALTGCDDHDSKTETKTAHRAAASSASRLGVGWQATTDGKLSTWSFAGDRQPGPPSSFDSIRAALASNMLPPRDSVRVADLIDRAAEAAPPAADVAEQSTVIITTTPWNDHTWLLWVAVSGLDTGGGGAKISVEFDPRIVAAFRPLGDVSALPDPGADSGRAEMLYELSPQPDEEQPRRATYATVHITRAGETARPFDRPVTEADFIDSIDNAPDRVRFATAVAGFGGLLRGDPAVRDLSCADVVALAESADQPDPEGRRGQLIDLMRKAEPLIDQAGPGGPPIDDQGR
jgi:hypothetical protein